MSFSYIDLFAGIGGLSYGFKAIGGTCVYANEFDKFARQTYAANNDHEPDGRSIVDVLASDIPDHDILLAGFPCQSFSLAGVTARTALGRGHGFEDETKGTLFFDVARIIEAKRPRAVVLENVKNLATHDGGRTFAVIRRTLERLGYRISWRIIDAAGLVPQNRKRVFIVGLRTGSTFDINRDVYVPSPESGPKLASILDTFVSSKYTIGDGTAAFIKRHSAHHKAAGNGFDKGKTFGPDDVSDTLVATYHKGDRPPLIAQPGKNPRQITEREAARLMGFDESFVIPVSRTQAYKQFGNSVVPSVSLLIAAGLRAKGVV